jgi:8-oxo-dGTP pyrophosphatase MutT (NUDIX family)
MGTRKGIEVIARGVCVLDGRLLLCHSRGAENTYLPGGHVEFGESAGGALVREIAEELGLTATLGPFLGAVEHAFIQKGVRHCELNLVFRMHVCGLSADRVPESAEPKLDFRWSALERLRDARLEPAPLCAVLADWLRREADTWASAVGGL